MTKYNSNYEIAEEISARLGDSPIPFESIYSIALEIYNELGGEPTQFDNVYSILLSTLPLVEGGIASKVIDDNVITTVKTWSSSKINSELGTKQDILPENVTELPCLVYEFEPEVKGLTEIPADKIDSNGNLIINSNSGFGAYGLHRSDVLEDTNTIYDGSKWYYNAMDIELLNYSKIVYRVSSTSYNNVYGLVRGLDNEITMEPSMSLKKPLSDETKAALVTYMEGLEGKVVCWNGIEGYIVGFNDVSNTPKIYSYTESDAPYLITGNTIFAGHTLLKKGHYYKIHCVRFNHYFEIPTSTSAQYISGWVLTFDEIGDLIKTVEDAAEKVDVIPQLQEYIASLEARIAALEGNTTVS